MKITHVIALTLSLASTLPLAACGDDPVEGPDTEGCEHLQDGPFQQLTAGATRDSSAPMIDDDHVAYRVTGPGFAFFAPAEAGDYHVFLGAAATLELTGPDGEVITPEETVTGSAACDEIAERLLVPLVVGTTFFELTSAGEVPIVLEPAAHDHAHE